MGKIFLDRDKCIGCGACVALCSDHFEMSGNKVNVYNSESSENAVKAADNCPVNAITIKE